jgi:tRNA 2-selenouridine synthase
MLKFITFTVMVRDINIEDFLRSDLPLADVRSPGEYDRGHIPGAVSIPLFTDDERAHVGTVFTRESPGKAMAIGLQYVQSKLSDFISRSEEISRDGMVAVHCWRGGMRSREFARHLSENGFKELFVITGGYKAFRNHILSFFNTPFHLQIIGGYTGSGKTEILLRLKGMGYQVVDLEGLACHKGSSFGGLGQGEQPTTEQFENELFTVFNGHDLSKPVWLEDESHNIGGVNIPMRLYDQMKKSPVFFLDIPVKTRAIRLVEEYATADPELIAAAITRISKRMGGQNATRAIQLLEEKKFLEMTLLILGYYDKSYKRALLSHDQKMIFQIRRLSDDIKNNTQAILNIHEAYTEHQADGV